MRRDTRFKKKKVRLFEKNVQIEYKKNESLRSNYFFSSAVISRDFWMESKRKSLSIRQGSKFS